MRKKNDHHLVSHLDKHFSLENSGSADRAEPFIPAERPLSGNLNKADFPRKQHQKDQQSGITLWRDPKTVTILRLRLQDLTDKKTSRNRPFGFFFGLTGVQPLQPFFIRGKKKEPTNMNKDCESIFLIRAAALAHQKCSMRHASSTPDPVEQLGIQVNVLRRSKQRNLDWLSQQTGYAIEELIAFEAGLLGHQTALEMLGKIAPALGISVVQPASPTS